MMDFMQVDSLNINGRPGCGRLGHVQKERRGETVADTASDGHCFQSCYLVIEDLTVRDDVTIK
jgi:hypothetical protein